MPNNSVSRACNISSMTPTEITHSTPAVMDKITSIGTNITAPLSLRTVASLDSACTSASIFSTSSNNNHTPATGIGCFTLHQRLEGAPPLNGNKIISRLNKVTEFVNGIPDIITIMEGSTNPLVTRHKNLLFDIQFQQKAVNKSISKKATVTYNKNIRIVKDTLSTISDKNLLIFFNSIFAIFEAKTSKVLEKAMSKIDGYMSIIEEKPNKIQNLTFFWRGIIDESEITIKEFLEKFDLWADFKVNVMHMLDNIDDDFIERQQELYDQLKTLCAPMSRAEENANISLHNLFIPFKKEQTVTTVIQSLQNNQGLIHVLKNTEHGKKLLKQLNNSTLLINLDTRIKDNDKLVAKIAVKRQEHNALEKSSIFKKAVKKVMQNLSSQPTLADLQSQLRASKKFSLSIAAEMDPGLKILSDFSPERVETLLNELKKDQENCDNVITAIGPLNDAREVTPEFMTESLSIFEAICVAHSLHNNRLIAENIHNMDQLYHIMRKKYLKPEIIDQLTFNRTDHEGKPIIKGLMLAALHQRAADPEMDWIAQINILLGFADDQHATLTEASIQKVRLRDNYEVNHFVNLDHFDHIKPAIVARINKQKSKQSFLQSINHDNHLIKQLNGNNSTEVIPKITHNMVDLLFCEGNYADGDIKSSTFNTILARLFKLAPQKFLSDLEKINYTPLHHKAHHANKMGNLLTPLQMASVDHLVVINQHLQEVISETITTLVHAENLSDDDIFFSLDELALAERPTLQQELGELMEKLNENPFDGQLKNKLKEYAEIILDAVDVKKLSATYDDELLNNIATMYNYFSSLRPGELGNFYAWMQELGLPLSNNSQEIITQYLTEMLLVPKDDNICSYEAMSVIIRELFASPLLSGLQLTPQSRLSVERLNKLSSQSLDQIDQFAQGIIDKVIAPLNPTTKQADRNLQALCRMIDDLNAIEETVDEFIIKPNIKNTSEKKARLTIEQYNFLKDGLYDLFKLGSNDFSKDIDKLFASMTGAAIKKSENDIRYFYNYYINLRQIYEDVENKKPQELYNEIIGRDVEKSIPALIAMGNLDEMKRITARLTKEIFTLGKMDVASHADFLKKLDDMHRLSSSIYFKIMRIKNGLSHAIDIRSEEVKYQVKRATDIAFSDAAASEHTLIQKMGSWYYDDFEWAKYRERCAMEDAISDQHKIDDRNKRDIWNNEMNKVSEEFIENFNQFFEEFAYWWTPIYVVYKTNVSDSHKSVIIFSNGQLFQSEDCHIYDGAITMLRGKRVDFMIKKGQLDQDKILAFIMKYQPNFKCVNSQITRKEVDYEIMATVENEDGYKQHELVATIKQTQTVNTTTKISTIPGSFMYGFPEQYPSPDDTQYIYKEFFFQPETLTEVYPAIATQICDAKNTWLPSYVANAPSLPDYADPAAIASTSASSRTRPSDPITDNLRDLVSPFTSNRAENLKFSQFAVEQMQVHLSHTIQKEIITINSSNQMTLFKPDGTHVLFDDPLNISSKDAKQGNYTTALPEHIMQDIAEGNTILLCEDRQHQFNAIHVQPTDEGYISSKIPHSPELRDSVINTTFNDFPESLKPAAKTLFSAVMNVGYTHFYGKQPQNDISTISLRKAFLERLNRTYEQAHQPIAPGYIGN